MPLGADVELSAELCAQIGTSIDTIAKAIGAAIAYSNDTDVQLLRKREGLECRGVWDLPARPVDPQGRPLGSGHAGNGAARAATAA